MAKSVKAYADKDVPLAGYLTLMATYAAVFGSLSYLSHKNKKTFVRPKGGDLVVLTIASYKISRVVTMSFIGSPLRAPFTKRGKSLPGGEVQDESRGEGLQRAVGNLLTCPFCFSVWSSTIVTFGYIFAPRATLQAAYILSMAAADDVLNTSWRALRETFAQ